MSGEGQAMQIRPSLWNLLWAAPLFLIGAGFFTYTLFHGLAHITDSLTQVVVPGHAELNLQHGQQYDVFVEEESVVNGKIYSTTQSIEGLTCRVTSVQTGNAVAVESASASASYTVNGRSGHSVLKFFIDKGGRYDFACDYGENPKGSKVVVAVGSGVGEAIFRMVGVGLLSGFGGMGAGALVIVMVILKREREKKRLWRLGQLQGPS